eukprot:198681-Amphidinium_carterae.3
MHELVEVEAQARTYYDSRWSHLEQQAQVEHDRSRFAQLDAFTQSEQLPCCKWSLSTLAGSTMRRAPSHHPTEQSRRGHQTLSAVNPLTGLSMSYGVDPPTTPAMLPQGMPSPASAPTQFK